MKLTKLEKAVLTITGVGFVLVGALENYNAEAYKAYKLDPITRQEQSILDQHRKGEIGIKEATKKLKEETDIYKRKKLWGYVGWLIEEK